MPSSKYLSRQSPVVRGLTFNEFLAQGCVGTAATIVLFFCLGFPLGISVYTAIGGFLVGAILSWFLFPKVASKIKGDMPSDTFQKVIRLKMVKMGFSSNPYTQYQGVWAKAKKVKE